MSDFEKKKKSKKWKPNQETYKTSEKYLNDKNNSWIFLKENQFWIVGYPRLSLAILSNDLKVKFSSWTDGSLSAALLLGLQYKCFVSLLMFKCQLYFYLPYSFLMDYFFQARTFWE